MFFINHVYSWLCRLRDLIKRCNARRKTRLKYNRGYMRAIDVGGNVDILEREDLLRTAMSLSSSILRLNFQN